MVDQTPLATTNDPSTNQGRVTLVHPSSGRLLFGVSEFWKNRHLLYVLAWRDVKVRYKQTVLGATWAVLQPFLSMVVFSLVFGRLAKVSSGGTPYPAFVFCGLLPWQFFAYVLVHSSNSLIKERYLLTKVYVPRLTLPVSSLLSGLLDFAMAFAVLLGIMFYYRISPTWAALTIPPLLVLLAATALSTGLFLSALNVRYRDVAHAVPFFTQLWFFVTPVAYPSSLVPERWRRIFELNPMAVVVEGFRWALLGSTGITWTLVTISAVTVTVLMLVGLTYFRFMEKTFADVV